MQRVVEIALFKVRPFSIGCALSFCLGVGLFGAVYLMPVFLAYVRQHDALQIGSIMLVTGAAQLVAAPIAGALESRLDSRLLSAFGFSLFAIGLGWSAFESNVADFDEMFWPQVLRGFAAMFCLLPPTRLALETLPHKQVPDASGLFNMMRNLGGAVGIALINTVLYGRTARTCRRHPPAPDRGQCDGCAGNRTRPASIRHIGRGFTDRAGSPRHQRQ